MLAKKGSLDGRIWVGANVVTQRREVRAVYDAETIRVYQAYSDEIADAALAAGTFVAPFKRDRMTWIKPSFLWMMYRSGWARKDPDSIEFSPSISLERVSSGRWATVA